MAMIPLTGKNPSIDSIIGLDISNPQDGQAIVYDAASGTWKNANAGGGGGGGGVYVVTATESGGTYTLDKTAAEIEEALTGTPFAVCKVANEDDGWDIWNLVGWYPYTADYGYTFSFKSPSGTVYVFEAQNGTDHPASS